MNVLKKIVEAINPFGYPYAPDIYSGSSDHYFVYNYADERGAVFGDDCVSEVTASVQVHFYLPRKENFIAMKNRIRKALESGGFTWPEVTILIEDDMRHIVFECEIDEELEEE